MPGAAGIVEKRGAFKELSVEDAATSNSHAVNKKYIDDKVVTEDILTTRGDLIYRNATVAARLAVGTNNQILGSNGTDPVWQAGSKSTLTTTGDLLYASAANTLARLTVGDRGKVLETVNGLPAWTYPTILEHWTGETVNTTIFETNHVGTGGASIDQTNHELDLTTGATSPSSGEVITLRGGDLTVITTIEGQARLKLASGSQGGDLGPYFQLGQTADATPSYGFWPSSSTQITWRNRGSGGDTNSAVTKDTTAYTIYNITLTTSAASYDIDGTESANLTTNINTGTVLKACVKCRSTGSSHIANVDYVYLRLPI